MKGIKIIGLLCISLVTASAQAQDIKEVSSDKHGHEVCTAKHKNHLHSSSDVQPGKHVHLSKMSKRPLKVGVKSPRKKAKIKVHNH